MAGDTHIVLIDPGCTRVAWKDLEVCVDPAGTLPPGRSVRLALCECTAPPFCVPTGLQLVSGVYLVAVSSEIRLILHVSLEHSPERPASDCSKLTFVSVDASNHPSLTMEASRSRTMYSVLGGQFKQHSRIGSVSMVLKTSAAIAIAQGTPRTV